MKTYAVTMHATLIVEVAANDINAAHDVVTQAFAPHLPVDPLAETRFKLPNWKPFVTDSTATIKTVTVDPEAESSVREA